jgi:hypothetical protein
LLDFYFFPKAFERNGLIYRLLGIPLFKQVIMATVGAFVLACRAKKDLASYFVTAPFSKKALQTTERWSRFNEIVHIVIMIITGFLARYALMRGSKTGFLLLIFAVLLNFYLILLQRYNRVKMYRLMESLHNRRRVG